QSRITTEAKRHLYFTEASAKEIAYRLGFSNPAHFSSFFKKCTGKSPSFFRKQNIGF
ncbi:MAG TPA: helix-turn-helix domain-containing protein, partial [Caldithrix abyssi]|nr:helix-turn-helix domain-containing protein [Caldithrix abyssi]